MKVAGMLVLGVMASLPHVFAQIPSASSGHAPSAGSGHGTATGSGLTYPARPLRIIVHMSMALLTSMTGVDLLHVHYTGGGPAVTAAIGGQVQLNIGTTAGVLPHVRSGRLRALAVTTAARSPAAPDVPTFAESGVSGYDHGPWNGLFTPAKTPAPILARLHGAAASALQAPEARKVFANDGLEAVLSTPAEFGAKIRRELAMWPKVIGAAGIKPE